MLPKPENEPQLASPNDDWALGFSSVVEICSRFEQLNKELPTLDFSSWYTPTVFKSTDIIGLYQRFTKAAGHLVIDVEAGQRELFLKQILEPKLAGTVLKNQIADVCHDVVLRTGFAEDCVELGAGLPDEVRDYLGDDPDKELPFIKRLILAGDVDPKNGELIPDLVMAQTLIAVADQNGEQSIPQSLLERAKEGEYDAVIVRDLLEDPEVIENTPPDLKQLVQLLTYTQRLIGLPLEATDPAIATMIENIKDWPDSVRKELASFKLSLATELQLAITRVKEDTYNDGVHSVLSPAPIDREAALDRAIQAIRNNTIQQAIGGNRLELVKAIVEQRQSQKRRALGVVASAVPEASPAVTEEKVKEPINLFWLDQSGISHPENSDAWRRHFRDYLKTYGNGDEKFYQDVNDIVEYLKTLDFSKGYPQGVKPGKGNYIGNAFFEFKPSYVPGLTKTQAADMIRIFFLLDSGKLEIIGMARKDKLRELNKKLGIGRQTRK